jgi:hypothetical protein
MKDVIRDQKEHLYSLLLVLPETRSALVESGRSGVELPCVAVPLYARPAEIITDAVLNKWSLKSVVIDWIEDQPGNPFCAILEVRAPGLSRTTSDLTPFMLNELTGHPSYGRLAAIALTRFGESSEERSPFSRFGWLDTAESWIRTSSRDHGIEFTTSNQLNAGDAFALIRLGTRSTKAYWLKAVGKPNTSEFTTTAYLVEHCPEYLPTILDMKPAWNAWIMEKFGSSLQSSESILDFEGAVRKLAALQIQLAHKGADLLAAQFVDHRLPALKAHIDDLFCYLDEIMPQQTSIKVKPLSARRLGEIRSLLHEACDTMSDQNVPDSLMHGDFSPGSILSDGVDCVFTDWCEAYVGNPFITFEQFRVRLRQGSGNRSHWDTRLVELYRSSWLEMLTNRQIEVSLALVPLLSVLSYMYGRGEWLTSSRRYDPAFQSYERSLARHMDRILAETSVRRMLCPSR